MRAAATLLALCAWALLAAAGAEEPTPEDGKPAFAVKPLQSEQRRLGGEAGKAAGDLEALLEEARQNVGAALQNRDKVTSAAARLEAVAGDAVPRIVSDLRDGTPAALRRAAVGQEQVAQELSGLLRAVQGELAPAASQRALAGALRRQLAALDRTQQVRLTQPELEGRRAAALSDDERKVLQETAGKQQDAALEIQRARKELGEQFENLKPADPPAADNIRRALAVLDQAAVRRKAQEAAGEISENRLRRAEERQQEVLEALRQADRQLAEGTDRTGRLQNNLAALQEARKLQEQALAETRSLDPRNDDAVTKAAQDQGEVTRLLGPLKEDDPRLQQAAALSEEAKGRIAQGGPTEAVASQQAVLHALGDALQSTAQQLTQARTQEDQALEWAEALEKTNILIEKQRALALRTAAVAPRDAQDLSQPQSRLAQQAGTLAAEWPPSPPLTPAQQAQRAAQAAAQAAQAATLAAREAQESADLAGQVAEQVARQYGDAAAAQARQHAQGAAEAARQAREAAPQAQDAAGQAGTHAQAAQTAEQSGQTAAAQQANAAAQAAARRAGDSAQRAAYAAQQAARAAEVAAEAGRSPEPGQTPQAAQAARQAAQAAQAAAQAAQAAAQIQAAGQPGAQGTLEQAAAQMQRAAQRLADQQPGAAGPLQAGALTALQQAAQALAALLTQADVTQARAALQQTLSGLAAAQTQVAQQTAQAGAEQMGALAAAQASLARRAQSAAQWAAAPPPAQDALQQAAEAMQQAAEALRSGQQTPAGTSQGAALASVTRASQALTEFAAQALPVAENRVAAAGQAPSPGAEQKAARGVFEYGRLGPVSQETQWSVTLPPRERAEVEQAAKLPLPERYRKQIILYYQNLAGAKRE